MPHTAFVSIGANLGAREAAVLRAVRLLESRGVGQVLRVSSLYESEPVGIPGAPRFINAVAEVATLRTPDDLLERLKSSESREGRSGGHGESREIDLDLIALGDTVLQSPLLTLPHPRFHERAFVLVPLREIAPGFCCPARKRPVGELVDDLPDVRSVVRVCGWSSVMRG
jgi:2-amino-4-hydroxy-6-hydroxymethyldihydropteridine diphosphokinase